MHCSWEARTWPSAQLLTNAGMTMAAARSTVRAHMGRRLAPAGEALFCLEVNPKAHDLNLMAKNLAKEF